MMKKLVIKKNISRMILYGIIGLCLFSLFNRVVFIDGRYEDVRKDREAMNPTSYVFNSAKKDVMGVLDSSFNEGFRKNSTFRSNRYPVERVRGYILRYLGANRDQGLELSRQVFSFVNTNSNSYVYRKKKDRHFLVSNFTFDLKIISLDSMQTRVDVVYKKSWSSAGYYLAFNPRLMNFKVPRVLDLGSTTIEEYEILRYIGKMLGQKDMPPVRYPEAVTLLDVRANFRIKGVQTLPFTEEEMLFGE